MSTNGNQATPPRDEIMRLSTYYAAIYNYFDTSTAAQQAGLLTISVMDMVSYDILPVRATHRFYVMINRTGSLVTRYDNDRYEVVPHDQFDEQREERELRTAVLDTALWFMTGEGVGYHPDEEPEAREAVIKELLGEGPDEDKERDEADPTKHAVVRDEEPDLTISLVSGFEGEPGPQVLRQWSVEVGPYNTCQVVFFGYEEDNDPVLVAMEAEPEQDGVEDEEDYVEENDEEE